jgi:glycosyltransferase involved in cell wall biosynthesis
MKVIFFANTDWYLFNFRSELAMALCARGDEIVLLSPQNEYAHKLQEMGFHWMEFPMSRSGMNPFSELGVIYRLYRFYRKEKPALVHHFTVKCVLYGSLAAHLSGIKAIVNSVTGLGFIFTGNNFIRKLLRFVVSPVYRMVLRGTSIIFQNPTDRDLFLSMQLVSPESAKLIPGSGVDIDLFHPSKEPLGEPVVLFSGRLLRDKGIFEFVEAARIIRDRNIPARFVLVGDRYDGNPTSISAHQLQTWQEDGVIEYWGWNDQMYKVYPQVNIVCLPSYREGLSKTLIEACASGRAIVTTDVPGCRDVVQHGENGLLVSSKNAIALANAIQELIFSPDIRRQMAIAGRKIAEQKFSSKKIIQETLEVYKTYDFADL